MAINYKKYEINDKAIDKVAKDMGYPNREVKKVIDLIASELTLHISSVNLLPFMLPYFGKFRVKPFRMFAVNNADRLRKIRKYGIDLMKPVERPKIIDLGNGFIRVEYRDQMVILYNTKLDEYLNTLNNE